MIRSNMAVSGATVLAHSTARAPVDGIREEGTSWRSFVRCALWSTPSFFGPLDSPWVGAHLVAPEGPRHVAPGASRAQAQGIGSKKPSKPRRAAGHRDACRSGELPSPLRGSIGLGMIAPPGSRPSSYTQNVVDRRAVICFSIPQMVFF